MISNTYHYHQSSLNLTSIPMHQHISHLQSDPIIQHIVHYCGFSLFAEQVFSSLRENNRRRNRVAHIVEVERTHLQRIICVLVTTLPFLNFYEHTLSKMLLQMLLCSIPATITKFLRTHVANDDLTRYLLAKADTDHAIEIHQICW